MADSWVVRLDEVIPYRVPDRSDVPMAVVVGSACPRIIAQWEPDEGSG